MTVRSRRIRQLIALLLGAAIMAAAHHYGIRLDPGMVEDVSEAVVETALAPDEEEAPAAWPSGPPGSRAAGVPQ